MRRGVGHGDRRPNGIGPASGVKSFVAGNRAVTGERVRQRQEAAPSPPAAGEGHQEAAEETMARSLRRYGHISPVVVCLR